MRLQRIEMIPAPTGIQPGNYVAQAYANHVPPPLQIQIAAAAHGGRWRIDVAWAAPRPVTTLGGETDRFVDAAALLVPLGDAAQWMTMGSPDAPVHGLLWRPDRPRPWAIAAQGLGSVARSEAPPDWQTDGQWHDGQWRLRVDVQWPALDAAGRAAVAIWRGALAERAGLKLVTPGWVDLRA